MGNNAISLREDPALHFIEKFSATAFRINALHCLARLLNGGNMRKKLHQGQGRQPAVLFPGRERQTWSLWKWGVLPRQGMAPYSAQGGADIFLPHDSRTWNRLCSSFLILPTSSTSAARLLRSSRSWVVHRVNIFSKCFEFFFFWSTSVYTWPLQFFSNAQDTHNSFR